MHKVEVHSRAVTQNGNNTVECGETDQQQGGGTQQWDIHLEEEWVRGRMRARGLGGGLRE